MSDLPDKRENSFHEFSLKTGLFKGRTDLYFCYLKSEKLAHAMARLSAMVEDGASNVFENLAHAAALFPVTVLRFAAGETSEQAIHADILELLSLTRLSVTRNLLSEEHALIIIGEYENIARKIELGKHASPFLGLGDLAVPDLPREMPPPSARMLSYPQRPSVNVRDIYKGQPKMSNSTTHGNKGQGARIDKILDFIRRNKQATIKDLLAVVKGCSSKTIQRDLAVLIGQGLVRKEGERRWSVYLLN